MTKPSRTTHPIEYRSDEYYRQLYGKNAVIVRLGQVTIIHLDNPGKEEIQRRTEEIMREHITGEAFDDGCPFCREFQKHPYEIVYYDQD